MAVPRKEICVQVQKMYMVLLDLQRLLELASKRMEEESRYINEPQDIYG